MNNTALSASVQLAQMQSIKTTHMVFRNRQHENFNYEKSEQAKRWDCYYKVLMYILGISEVTRRINLHYQKFCHRQKSMEEKTVLKIRLMGTKNDIKWFEKILKRQSKVVVTDFSELYRNKGTNRFYRAYAEVHKVNKKEN